MKMISWNVNGLQACAEKGIYGFLPGNRRRPVLRTGNETAGGADQLRDARICSIF